jgi:hypothetical protein
MNLCNWYRNSRHPLQRQTVDFTNTTQLHPLRKSYLTLVFLSNVNKMKTTRVSNPELEGRFQTNLVKVSALIFEARYLTTYLHEVQIELLKMRPRTSWQLYLDRALQSQNDRHWAFSDECVNESWFT